MDQASHGKPQDAAAPGAFRLMRYFTIATLVAFVAVAAVLLFLQRGEEVFFDQVQREQRDTFAQAQATLARQHEAAARASLLAVHEASHVNLTRLVANLLWRSDFGPFVEQVQRVTPEACAVTDAEGRRACAAARGARIRALPGYAALHAKAYAAMHSTSVFKIKVFDLRGITVYSSEAAQIGDDASGNAGWKTAAAGRPASELTHRDRFSAFEGVVENRDLISSYVPVRTADGAQVLGVFELYSDVTPFLDEIRVASRRFAELTEAQQADVAQRSQGYTQQVKDSSDHFLLVVVGLLALLYGVSLLIVYRGQRLIDRQAQAQEAAARREQVWHREKMAALATMAANVSHEVGNPLAVIAGIAQQLPPHAEAGEPAPARRILEQTTRIAQMMRRISDFTDARGLQPEWVDVNTLLKALCDFHAFDRRFRAMPIRFEPGAQLPACSLVPDHLNEAVMTLLQALLEARPPQGDQTQVRVVTTVEGDAVVIALHAGCATSTLAADPRLDSVRRRVADMAGTLDLGDGVLHIRLPAHPPPD
ncbi:MAG: hypothetical protein U1F56_07160 [Rubrivivax sp.]